MPRRISPAQFLVLTFAGLIAVGSLLLYLPLAAESEPVSYIDALFTSTSAVCVTGLIVRDTPKAFSTFGEVTIMLLVAAGGLGYMTISTVVASLFGRRLSLREQMTLKEALNVDSREGLVRFAATVLVMALTFEFAGAAILTVRWWGDLGFWQSAYFGLFHAVSAFNNAGFALFSDNLMSYRGDATVNLVITLLIICGGLGFLVLKEIGSVRSWRRLSLHTKLVLVISGGLVVAGTLSLLVLEWFNPRTLGPLSVSEKFLAAYFQAITPRTAGFNTIDIGAMTPPSLFIVLALMFIGASPGSTGGGVKTTTFGITVFALWATVRGDREPVIFGRRITTELVARAFFISLIAFLTVNLVAGMAMVAEGHDVLSTLFETTSAFGTVGLSMGSPGSVLSLSAHFTTTGRLLMILMMFLGRVGPLTVAVALAARHEHRRVHYPEGRVLIG